MNNLLNSTNNRYVYLEWLRALSIIGVVYIHTFDPFVSFTWNGSITWSQVAIAALARFAVPMYVMMSGALLLHKRETAKQFYTKRFKRVVIPLISWSGIFLLWYSMREPSFNWYDALFRLIIFGQPFYLIFILIGLYVITPFLRTYVQNASKKELWAVTLFCLGWSSLVALLQEWLIAPRNILPLFSINYFVLFLGYYLAGHVMHHYKAKKNQLGWFFMIGGYLIAAMATIWFSQKFGASPKGLVWWGYLSPAVMFMTLGVFILFQVYSARLEKSGIVNVVVSLLAVNSLGIYYLHQLLLNIFSRDTIAVVGLHPLASGLLFVISILGSLLLISLLKKIRPISRVLGLI